MSSKVWNLFFITIYCFSRKVPLSMAAANAKSSIREVKGSVAEKMEQPNLVMNSKTSITSKSKPKIKNAQDKGWVFFNFWIRAIIRQKFPTSILICFAEKKRPNPNPKKVAYKIFKIKHGWDIFSHFILKNQQM